MYIVAIIAIVISSISCEMELKKKRNQYSKTEQIQKSKEIK